MKALAVFFLAMSVPAIAAPSSGAWVPEVSFSLEDGKPGETMQWLSGWAYALTELGKANANTGGEWPICLPPNGHVESRVLLDILNKEYRGRRITSEQAATTLWAGAVAHYRCVSHGKMKGGVDAP